MLDEFGLGGCGPGHQGDEGDWDPAPVWIRAGDHSGLEHRQVLLQHVSTRTEAMFSPPEMITSLTRSTSWM